MGSEIVIDLKVDGEIIKVKTLKELKLNIGDKVWMRFDENKMHIFDIKTEKTII